MKQSVFKFMGSLGVSDDYINKVFLFYFKSEYSFRTHTLTEQDRKRPRERKKKNHLKS